MKRMVSFSVVFAAVAAAAFAASGAMSNTAPRTIYIEVASDELADCRETLADVASMPAYSDQGSLLLFTQQSDLPSVECIAIDA